MMERLGNLLFVLLFCNVLPALSAVQDSPLNISEDCETASTAMRNMTTYQIQISYSNSSTDDNSVVFQLYNPVIGVDAQCAAYGSTLGVGDSRNDTWYQCFIESLDTRISASFKYDFVLNQVTVNETWACDSPDPSRSYVYLDS